MSHLIFKLVFIGDSGVGKSCLVERTVSDCYHENIQATIPASFHKYVIKTDDNITVTYNIWDTAGQERWRSLVPLYYRGCDAAILCYDITKSYSFENIEYWIQNLRSNHCTNAVLALVGNKSDLEHKRDVDYKVAKRFANKNDLIFMETSAKTALNIDLLFKKITQELIKPKKSCEEVKDNLIKVKLNKHNKRSHKINCC